MPTVLEMSNVGVDYAFDGKSLLPCSKNYANCREAGYAIYPNHLVRTEGLQYFPQLKLLYRVGSSRGEHKEAVIHMPEKAQELHVLYNNTIMPLLEEHNSKDISYLRLYVKNAAGLDCINYYCDSL